jgi:RNA polymerase sigma factor for flagellar operon FliA
MHTPSCPLDPREEIVEALDTHRAADALSRALDELGPRDRALITRHVEGESLLEVGKEMGMSKSWASRLHTRALARVRERARELLHEGASACRNHDPALRQAVA